MQHAACSMQHAAYSMQYISDITRALNKVVIAVGKGAGAIKGLSLTFIQFDVIDYRFYLLFVLIFFENICQS